MTNAEIIDKARTIIYDPERNKTISPSDIGDLSAALGIARILARAQRERGKGCEYCNNPDALEAYIEMGDKYCRHCGRPLTEN